jgi:hypothetical protein
MLSNKDQLISGIIMPLQSCSVAEPVGSLEKDLQKRFLSAFVKDYFISC